MLNFLVVTEDQVKAEYLASPSCNQHMTWEEVKEYQPMYNILKMQAEQHLFGEQAETQEVKQAENRRLCGIPTPPKLTVVRTAPAAAEPTEQKRPPVVILGKKRLQQIQTALGLARSCLQSPAVNDTLRDEALQELSQVLKFLTNPPTKH